MAEVETRTSSQASTKAALVCLAVAAVVVLAGLVFVLARRLDWTLGWIYVGLMAAGLAINLVCLLRWNPELIARRMWFGEGTKRWDVVWSVLASPLAIAVFVVAWLEAREGVGSAPGVAWLVGMALLAPSWALIVWSMAVNPFFEKTVRIQTDRGHRVIDSGPYARVRHPGYVGFSGWLLSTPLLLGSAWAAIPAVLFLVGLVIRTALEDRMLQAELPGYSEYAARVRFRLIPGLW
jgi:protein-S-isoprenylcysteine O-methyltransferase Ste14